MILIPFPYFQTLDDAPKILTGDNLESWMSATIEGVLEETDTKLILQPLMSTRLLQPLDVAVYGPIKKAWLKVLRYKNNNYLHFFFSL